MGVATPTGTRPLASTTDWGVSVHNTRIFALSTGLLALLAGCATGMPDTRGNRVLALHAGLKAKSDRGDAYIVRNVAAKPGPRAGDRIRAAAMDWAQRYSVSIRRTETHRGSGLMEFTSLAEKGHFELLYRYDDNDAWAVLSYVPPRSRSSRQRLGGSGERLARQWGADALADAIEQALTPPEVAFIQ